jgi:AraC-like DNA-binding protein
MIGKTDFDLHPRGHAEKYRIDDRRVMESGKPMLNIVELFLDVEGIPTWHVTNKMPVFSHDGKVIGVMGTIETYEARRTLGLTNKSLLAAYEHIRAHFHEEVSIRDLAARCQLSVRQFERKFREQVWATPRELIVRMRVQHACDALRETKEPLAEIALSSGFYDQASFNRQFKKHLGITPGEYRRRFG